MSNKIKIDDIEIDLEDISDKARVALKSLQFTDRKLRELSNMKALLQRARNSYIESLRLHVIQQKSGFEFGNED